MRFTPKTEKEISESNLWPEGEYDAEIGTAEDTISRSGNEMIKLDLTVFDKEGKQRFVYDYLLESMAFKLRHAAEACGLLDKYELGDLRSDDFIGKTCRVKLKIQKDKTGAYPDKNVIGDYVVERIEAEKKAEKAKDQSKLADDSIPF